MHIYSSSFLVNNEVDQSIGMDQYIFLCVYALLIIENCFMKVLWNIQRTTPIDDYMIYRKYSTLEQSQSYNVFLDLSSLSSVVCYLFLVYTNKLRSVRCTSRIFNRNQSAIGISFYPTHIERICEIFCALPFCGFYWTIRMVPLASLLDSLEM